MTVTVQDIISQLEAERRTVAFDAYDIIIRQLVDMIRTDEINISPDYQRQFIWNAARESELIESILLGIPVPSLYMAVNNADGTWEVVDGVQRLSTIMHFMGDQDLLNKINRDSPLVLEGLSKLDTLNDLTFGKLPPALRSGFMNRGFRVTTLNDRSDYNVRFDLFERLNTGGVALHTQEIRTILFRGKFKTLLNELSSDTAFKKVVRLSSQKTAADYQEAVLRFFAFVENYEDFDHSVKEFLNDYMKTHSVLGPKDEMIDLFNKTFELLSAALPLGIVRTRAQTPINLFEAISVGTALALKAGAKPEANVINALLADVNLRALTSEGTNNRRMVTGRIEFVRDALVV